MFFAARSPFSVGVVRWPGGTAATVILKRIYLLVDRGVATACEPEPLTLERRDEAGVLLHPSDFAPTKAQCDVGIVGASVVDPAGPFRIVVEPMRKLAERAVSLGPRSIPGPLGDPTDVASTGDWTRADYDFDRFQWSPGDQRLAPPSLPLEVVVDAGRRRVVSRIEGPTPEVLGLDTSGWKPPSAVDLRLDAIGLDVARQRAELVWRGLIDLRAIAEPLLVVEASGPIRAWPMREIMGWRRAEAVEPAQLRRLAATSTQRVASSSPLDGFGDDDEEGVPTGNLALDGFGSDDGRGRAVTAQIPIAEPRRSVLPFAPLTATSTTPRGTETFHGDDEDDPLARTVTREVPEGHPSAAGLPFRPPVGATAEDHDPLVGTVAVMASPARSAALPFVDPGPAARAPAPAPSAPARHDTLTLDLAEARDSLVGTVAVVAPQGSPLPFRSAVPAPPPPVAAPAVPAFALAAAATPSPPVSPGPPPVAHGEPRSDVSGLTLDQFTIIQAQLWTAIEGRRETLRTHGVTEVQWRLAQRRFAQAIGAPAGADARLAVRRLRDQVSRARPRRGA